MNSGSCHAIELEIPVADRKRRAVLCVSGGTPPAGGWPLVIAYHGGQSHPEMMRRFSGLDVLAERGFAAVAYPAGTGPRESLLTWNGGNCCGEAKAQESDDVGFTRRLVDAVARRIPIDGSRIHATGMSNGAMMAYRVAAEAADLVVSIAAVAGPLAFFPISPSRPVSVVHFHGTLDEFTPYAGGVGKRSITRVSHKGAVESVGVWVAANGCDPEGVREPVACSDPGIGVERTTWRAGSDGPAVVLYTIVGGGHTWPGRRPDSFFLGPSALSLDANRIIEDFLRG